MERLTVDKLSHSFGFSEILRDISFTLNKGEVLSVVGPSGSGKTTLLHLCAGLLDIEEGKLLNSFSNAAFAFQEPRLLPWKNTLDNIAIGLIARGDNRWRAIAKAKEIAFTFGLEPKDLSKFPKDLSGGMKQRVSFARALVLNPSLLFLDEPFSALDIGLKQELQSHLTRMVHANALTVFFITHDIMEAVRLSDRILLLKTDPGEIVKSFTLDRPQHERDNAYVYEQTAIILRDPEIIETFELGMSCGR